jgi:hypothetical protein
LITMLAPCSFTHVMLGVGVPIAEHIMVRSWYSFTLFVVKTWFVVKWGRASNQKQTISLSFSLTRSLPPGNSNTWYGRDWLNLHWAAPTAIDNQNFSIGCHRHEVNKNRLSEITNTSLVKLNSFTADSIKRVNIIKMNWN